MSYTRKSLETSHPLHGRFLVWILHPPPWNFSSASNFFYKLSLPFVNPITPFRITRVIPGPSRVWRVFSSTTQCRVILKLIYIKCIFKYIYQYYIFNNNNTSILMTQTSKYRYFLTTKSERRKFKVCYEMWSINHHFSLTLCKQVVQ